MNALTPKADFLKNSRGADQHMEIVLSPQFRGAAGAALLEYVMSLDGGDPRSTYKMAGAREVMNVLLNLGVASFALPSNQTEELAAV